ncbi:hypothetical protein F9B85_09570 [Heliorestis acidaminivorans]|uniref:Tetratricopeptide repeat protein n=1 Tax=Heliorestis acidaminivorans TaxID=553427 RepID=A0A6I0ERV4_9FIRM|nr:hypothetical protein [Heliorestis acidaminivorans]KAB2952393.1 hypothetical protein F9B85_09570 [Heliorestis acidaminivorans]
MDGHKISQSLKLLLATRRYGLAGKIVAWDEDATEAKVALALSILRGDHDWFYKITELWDPYYCSDLPYIDKADPESSDRLWFLLRCHGDIGYRGVDWRYLPLYRYCQELIPDNPFLVWTLALAYGEKKSLELEALQIYEQALQIPESLLVEYDSRPIMAEDENFASLSWFRSDLNEVISYYLWEAGRYPAETEVHQRCQERLLKARLYKEALSEEDVEWLCDQLQRQDRTLLTDHQKVAIYRNLASWALKEGRVQHSLLPLLEEGNRYLSIWDKPKVEALIGKSYLRSGEWEKAVYWLQRANLRKKNDSHLALFLARAFFAWFYALEKSEKSITIFEECYQAWLEVLALQDYALEALLVLAELAEVKGDLEESQKMYEQALELLAQEPYSDDDYGRVYLRFALLLFRREKEPEATELLEQGAVFWYGHDWAEE